MSGRLLNVGSRIQNGNRIFSIIADPSAEIPSDTTSDVLLRLHQHHVSVCWVGGCAQRAYSPEALVFLGRSTSDPWWGAWHPIITGALGLSVMLALWVGWGLLATVYAMLAKGIACFADRELSWPGSWRLCAAALLPGALLLGAALTAYGVGAIDLIRFIAFFFIHLVIGIFYTLAAPFFLPPLPSKTAGKNNPFENGSEKKP